VLGCSWPGQGASGADEAASGAATPCGVVYESFFPGAFCYANGPWKTVDVSESGLTSVVGAVLEIGFWEQNQRPRGPTGDWNHEDSDAGVWRGGVGAGAWSAARHEKLECQAGGTPRRPTDVDYHFNDEDAREVLAAMSADCNVRGPGSTPGMRENGGKQPIIFPGEHPEQHPGPTIKHAALPRRTCRRKLSQLAGGCG